MVTVWSKSAWLELQKAYWYISLESIQNAEKVRDEILDLTEELPNHPEKHPPDKFKEDNDGTWRAFEKHRYRISYRITLDEIQIIRLRHTSRSPLKF